MQKIMSLVAVHLLPNQTLNINGLFSLFVSAALVIEIRLELPASRVFLGKFCTHRKSSWTAICYHRRGLGVFGVYELSIALARQK